MTTPYRLLLPHRLYLEMVNQALAELPNECCGLLAGRVETEGEDRIGRVTECYPLHNAAASPVEYLSDPRGMFEAQRDMRRKDLHELAVYHSHPRTDPVPSRTDLERSYGPGVMNLIVSLKGPEPEVRAWWLTADAYREAEWECPNDATRH